MTAVIFDLDNCLAPADEVGKELYAPAFDAIRSANRGSVPDGMLDKAFSDIWSHAFDWVARRYHFTPEMFDAGWQQFVHMEVERPMKGYGDLHLLSSVPGEKFLVTSGFRRLQESKIRALGIASIFREVHVDAIDEPDRVGKKGIFQDIVARYGYRRGEVFIVGDNPDSEIRAGRELDLRTVQTLRPTVVRTDDADTHISGLRELMGLLSPV